MIKDLINDLINEIICRYRYHKFMRTYNLKVKYQFVLVSPFVLNKHYSKLFNITEYNKEFWHYAVFKFPKEVDEDLEWLKINKDHKLPITPNSKESVEVLASTTLINMIKK